MKTSNNSTRVQYAVIQLRQSDGGIERIVIQYHDERILRQTMARPSIIAAGFLSRDEATKKSVTAGIGNRVPLFRLQGRASAARVINNMVHMAAAALHKLRSRLTHPRRRLEPAVQQQ